MRRTMRRKWRKESRKSRKNGWRKTRRKGTMSVGGKEEGR